MDEINLMFKLVNNLKYYLEIDGVMVFPESTNQNIAFFKLIAHRHRSLHRPGPAPIHIWHQGTSLLYTMIHSTISVLDLAGRMLVKSHVCTRFATNKFSFTSKCRLNFYLFGHSRSIDVTKLLS